MSTEAGTVVDSLGFGVVAGLAFAPQTAVTPVPEPSSVVLMGIGIAGLFGYGRRRRRKSGNAQ
jgi:hypothetical protein